MEVAKDKLTIIYDDTLQGNPLDVDLVVEDMKLATEELSKALAIYAKAIIARAGGCYGVDSTIRLSMAAQEKVHVKIDNVYDFYLLDENGNKFIARIDKRE